MISTRVQYWLLRRIHNIVQQ